MKIHFIAIGGSVMHQLAIALKQKGYEVSGSDDEIFDPARSNLLAAGILPAQLGWFPEKISPQLDAVVVGMHARDDNPELQKARALQLRIYSFPEFIAHESCHKTRLVVGGSHGKTTITGMIMHVLKACGRTFDYLVGAAIPGFSQAVQLTDAPVIVCEGDEYPASALDPRPKFHLLKPHIAIISGISWDHINVFPTWEQYLQQFAQFIALIEPHGTLIYNQEDATVRQLVEQCQRTDLQLIGYSRPEWTVEKGITFVYDHHRHPVPLRIFGEHNLLNLQAARRACALLGVSDTDFFQAISSFTGASRRLELLAAYPHSAIYRDFAHAPSKVKATIQALRKQFPGRKLIAVLELHTYSSLSASFQAQYAGCMDEATVAAVFYSPHALALKRLPTLTPEAIRQGFQRDDLHVFQHVDNLLSFLEQQDYQDTNLLLMSSGNFDGMDIESIRNLPMQSNPSLARKS
ncbi:MAG: peptidoglycan synthetase [Thermoflavifilum sp.]|nr:peptidoglycan synthetase [Thermoflavifilum sp.]